MLDCAVANYVLLRLVELVSGRRDVVLRVSLIAKKVLIAATRCWYSPLLAGGTRCWYSLLVLAAGTRW